MNNYIFVEKFDYCFDVDVLYFIFFDARINVSNEFFFFFFFRIKLIVFFSTLITISLCLNVKINFDKTRNNAFLNDVKFVNIDFSMLIFL